MPIDFGEAIANIGNIWRQRQQDIDASDEATRQHAMEQARLNLDVQKAAQEHAHQLYLQSMAQQQFKAQQQQAELEQQGQRRSAVLNYAGPNTQIPTSALAGLGMGPESGFQGTAISPTPESAGSKIYTSPDAQAPETVGVVPPGMWHVNPTFAQQLQMQQQGTNEGRLQATVQGLLQKGDMNTAIIQLKNAQLENQRTLAEAKEAQQAGRATAQAQKTYHAQAAPYEAMFSQYGMLKKSLDALHSNNLSDYTGAQNTLINAFRNLQNDKVFAPRMTALAQETEHMGVMNRLKQWEQANVEGRGGYIPLDVAEGLGKLATDFITPRVGEYQDLRDQHRNIAQTMPDVNGELVVGKDRSAGLIDATHPGLNTNTAPSTANPKDRLNLFAR